MDHEGGLFLASVMLSLPRKVEVTKVKPKDFGGWWSWRAVPCTVLCCKTPLALLSPGSLYQSQLCELLTGGQGVCV